MILTRIKTAVLLASLSGLLLLIGGFIGGNQGIIAALIIALIINGISYFFSDKIVLSLYKAQPLDRIHYKSIYETVESLSRSLAIPAPKLWIIDAPSPNAFATGRNPHTASVAFTRSIIEILTADELRGVIAHELSHIANRDILIGTIAATLALAIGYIAQMLEHMVWWSTFSRSANEKEGKNPLILLIIALIMPIAATLIQLAVSRSRELLADECGGTACHDPLALASALEKLEAHARGARYGAQEATHTATAHLFIISPLHSGGITALFATHPPTAVRVARLKKLYEQLFIKRGRGYGS
jgi:heat shock protein HtpX